MASLLTTTFPWRNGNQFNLHVDGKQFFPGMLAAIRSSQQTICLEMYLCGSGNVFSEFRDALIDAALRGVAVRVLLDDFGSLQVHHHDRELLLNAGVQLKFYNPLDWRRGLKNLLRNHRKVLIIDHHAAFTGGAGLIDEFVSGDRGAPAWHDVMLEVQGPVVADWQQLFDRTWFGIRKHLALRRVRSEVLQPRDGEHAAGAGRVVASYGPQAHEVLQSLHRRLKTARHRAWLVTPYFMPSWKLRQRLIKAAHRGVDTRVLVPGVHTDHPALRQASRRYYSKLLREGVRIFEYQPRFIHAKIALCDDWISVGSTNFDRWNVRWNLDANQEAGDHDLCAQLAAMLDADFAHSVELKQEDWQHRPWLERFAEWATGVLERWSGRLR